MDYDAPDSPESFLIGGPIQENLEKVQHANPITYITPDDPPFLIMHGDKDKRVPYHQSVLLFNALKKANVDVTMYKIRGAGHGGFSQPVILNTVRQFFDKHLKAKR
ncbi:prolyl oligopeptidase family serine peptidase [Bacillus sp. T3]|uniref:prolyl oligopeptidase family serine peptidase n=1 Tax=Bacillus sp. T3 TaxID=467262 RepID=UPI0029822105|nr:prolyl oligopeptidase family serine peptidase [Bacillus sp. T3]